MEKNIVEIQETELKAEKSKKILIIFIVLLLFGGTCYYYAGANNSISKQHQNKIVFKAIQQKNNILIPEQSKNSKQVISENFSSQNEKKPETKEEIIAEKPTTITKFKPTDKSIFLTISNKSSGKHDPFSYSESRFVPFTPEQNQNPAYPGTLPPVPNAGSTGTLPTLAGIPGMSSAGLAPPPTPKAEDMIQIKGFIGNKVIAEVDGVVESLNVNEKINNVKVISVDPSSFTAKFEINGKKVSKTIKNLSYDHNGELQLFKLK